MQNKNNPGATEMKNRSIILITLIGIMIFTMACTITLPDNVSLRQVRGSGDVVEETRNVSGFDTVVLKGIGNIYIEQGTTEGLRIEAEDNLIELMEIDVIGDRLEIGFRQVVNIRPTRPINFYVTMIDVESIQLLGSGNINASPLIDEEIRFVLAGSGNISVEDIQTEILRAELPGSGNINISGTATRQEIRLMGSGDYDGRDLQSREADISIAGSGNVTVDASEQLDITIAGSGTVRYIGDPLINQNIFGSGRIVKQR
jgi:hypothetical protein